MKPRIPLAYAGLLVIALVAVVGFAAFSPSSRSDADPTTTSAPTTDIQASARVASAVLALRVSDAESRTATTEATITSSSVDASADEAEALEVAPVATTSSPPPSTTNPPVAEPAPSTTAAPKADTTPPAIEVTSPKDGATVSERLVTFKGTTEPGASVSSGPFAAAVDDDGNWLIKLIVSDGANGAVFTATDAAGNRTSVRIVIHYDAPTTTTQPPATTTTTKPSTTTTAPAGPKWSPLWPADAGGKRNVEAWRSLVAQYWPADLVDCALNIIDLESQGDPRAYNSSVSAEGLFQHLSKYWKGRAGAAGFRDAEGLYATPYNAEANIAAAWHIAKNSSPWYKPWSVDPFYGNCTP